jgi:hypothetical protein
VFLLILTATHAQDFTSSKNVLLDMKSSSSPDVLNALDDFKMETEREKKLYNRNLDSLRVMVQYMAYDAFYEELSSKKNIKIADKDALRDHVQYDKTGFPSILIPKTVVKKLVNNGYEADYYFSLGVSVNLPGVFSGINTVVKPSITCDIKVFSPDRDVVKNVDNRYKIDKGFKSFDFPERNFDKLAFDHIMILAKKLKPYVEEAVKEVVEKM